MPSVVSRVDGVAGSAGAAPGPVPVGRPLKKRAFHVTPGPRTGLDICELTVNK